MRIHRIILYTLSALTISSIGYAQGTVSDYNRAAAVDTLFKDKVYNNPSEFYWLKSGDKVWYLNKGKTKQEFILVDIKKRTQAPAFDHQRLAKSLAQQSHKKVDAAKLPFREIAFSDDRKSITFRVDSSKWKCNLSSYACEVVEILKAPKRENWYWGNGMDETANEPVTSPDSVTVAFIRNYNVFVRTRSKEEFQLSYDGAAGNFYSSYLQWSPDGKKIMAYKVRPGEKHLIYFVESSPKDQLQPKLCTREYLKPGDVLPHRQPQLFLVEERKHIPVSDALFSRQYALEYSSWRKDSRAFTLEYNERGHQNYRVLEVNATSGQVRVLVDEHSDTFIDYSGKRFRQDVNDGKEIIWASERDGWNHLYLYDGATGNVINQVTKGPWVVRGVVHVDEKQRQIIFSASGMDEGKDPYLLQYCRINFDGTGLVRLTKGDVNHVATFSPDHAYFVDRYSRVDLSSVTRICSATDGKEIMPLQQADISDLQRAGWKAPEVFSAKGRDGVTDIWGMIIRPTGFDPAKKYPVIEMIYAGPQSFYVPKEFFPQYRGLYTLAELGFIVVQMDGMGTSWRSKAFHDVCWKNLKDAGFTDRIAWMKAAATKYPYMDIARVGVFGGSAGGQNAAAAVLFHPEFYKAAVASCGCHDNRMDKMWWNEQWMGYPVGPHYAESSNVVNAHRLGGKLMLIVGEVDDNVDPASTMQLADALIKAKKDFELIVVPGMAHSGGGDYGERKRKDFFVKHLLGVDPPEWSEAYP